jgi:hypothetical protein
MIIIFSKKLSWFFLISLFTFDAVFSYWAVVFRGAHESNPAIKTIVEAYPMLYFITIPGLVLIMYPIYKGLSLFTNKLFKKVNKEIIEKVILTALVFYWILGNSSVNFLFLIGHRQPAHVWYLTTTLAVVPALTYSLIFLRKQSLTK